MLKLRSSISVCLISGDLNFYYVKHKNFGDFKKEVKVLDPVGRNYRGTLYINHELNPLYIKYSPYAIICVQSGHLHLQQLCYPSHSTYPNPTQSVFPEGENQSVWRNPRPSAER